MASVKRFLPRLCAAILAMALFFSAVSIRAEAEGLSTLGSLFSALTGTNETINTALYLSKSILAMKDGALPEDMAEEPATSATAEPNRDQLARLREAQAKYTALILALVTKNAKTSMLPEVITVDGKSVVTLGMTASLDTDALCTIVETLLTRTEENAENQRAAALLLELSVAGLGKTGDQLLSELRENAAVSIREMELAVTVSLNTAIKSGNIARMLLKVSAKGSPFAVRYTSANKGSGTLEFLTDAGQLFSAKYTTPEKQTDPYVASMILTGKQISQTELTFQRSGKDNLWHLDAFVPSTGEETALTFQVQEDTQERFAGMVILREHTKEQETENTAHVALEKQTGTFQVTASGSLGAASLTGKLEKDGTNTRIRIDTVNGLPTQGMVLTVPAAKLPALNPLPADSLPALQQSVLSLIQNGAVSMLMAPEK